MQGEMLIFRPDAPLPERRTLSAAPELEELQGLVGGYLEAVPLWKAMRGNPCVAFCDEDGKAKKKPVNVAATDAWFLATKMPMGDVLVGTVVVLTGDHEFMKAL